MGRLRRSEIARRQHRRRQLFAAGEGSTEAAIPQAPTVAILLNSGVWLDISTDVRFEAGIRNVNRGRTATDTKLRAGSAGPMQINNLDGKYSPRNPIGPLYGLIGRNTQCRISRRGTYRFWGVIPEWPPEWTDGGQDAWVNLTVAGIMRQLLATNAPVLQSALTRATLAGNPVSGWTLEDSSGATVAAPTVLGGPVLVPFGTASFAGDTTLGGASSAPNIGSVGTGFSGNVLPITGSWGVEFATKAIESLSVAMIYITDTNGNTFNLVTPWVLPTNHMQVNIGTEALTVTSEPWNTDAQFNNAWYYYAMYFQQSGAKIACQLYINGVQVISQNTSTSFTLGSPARLQAPQDVTTPKTIGSDGSLKSISHINFYANTVPTNAYLTLNGYIGENAGRRLQRLCSEQGIGFVYSGSLDDTMPMGPQGVDKFVDLIFDCESADMGFLYEDNDSFSIGYAPRSSMWNQSATLALDYNASGNIVLPLVPADNDSKIINDSTVQRKGGGSVRVAVTTGPMSTAAPSAGGIGSYPENPTVNVQSDTNAGDVAGWHVNIGTTDRQRFDQVNVNVANTITNHNLIGLANQMCNMQIGNMITIDNPPVWAQTDQIRLICVGIVESFDQFRHTITYNTVLADPYTIGLLDDPILGHIESDGTYLVSAIGTADLSMTVATVTGELWITNILSVSGDFPFDIMMGGERMTIGGISNTPPNQLWVMARSINGVLKPHAANESIIVRNPMRLA